VFVYPSCNLDCLITQSSSSLIRCASFSPSLLVAMASDGTLTRCEGRSCGLGNPAIDTLFLSHYSATGTLRVTGTSTTVGLTCTIPGASGSLSRLRRSRWWGSGTVAGALELLPPRPRRGRHDQPDSTTEVDRSARASCGAGCSFRIEGTTAPSPAPDLRSVPRWSLPCARGSMPSTIPPPARPPTADTPGTRSITPPAPPAPTNPGP
jgi:hypothetical protein